MVAKLAYWMLSKNRINGLVTGTVSLASYFRSWYRALYVVSLHLTKNVRAQQSAVEGISFDRSTHKAAFAKPMSYQTSLTDLPESTSQSFRRGLRSSRGLRWRFSCRTPSVFQSWRWF